ncbi:MAG: AAA family ATPase [Ilumatobacteraceae bacterium]
MLADDGHDLAAALATIEDMGRGPALREAVHDAFPGAELMVEADRGVCGLGLVMPGLRRPMGAHELSDGTLRYLSLVAALLTPRTPELLVLNEPETSLHGSLIEPLARLVVEAAIQSQIVVTTHSSGLAAALAEGTGQAPIVLRRTNGAATVDQ